MNTKNLTVEEILAQRYPRYDDPSVTVTVDPDMGAGGNWRALRSYLRGDHLKGDHGPQQ